MAAAKRHASSTDSVGSASSASTSADTGERCPCASLENVVERLKREAARTDERAGREILLLRAARDDLERRLEEQSRDHNANKRTDMSAYQYMMSISVHDEHRGLGAQAYATG